MKLLPYIIVVSLSLLASVFNLIFDKLCDCCSFLLYREFIMIFVKDFLYVRVILLVLSLIGSWGRVVDDVGRVSKCATKNRIKFKNLNHIRTSYGVQQSQTATLCAHKFTLVRREISKKSGISGRKENLFTKGILSSLSFLDVRVQREQRVCIPKRLDHFSITAVKRTKP